MVDGVKETLLAAFEIGDVTFRCLRSRDGVLLKENARPTFNLVLVANLNAFESVPSGISLTSMPRSDEGTPTTNFSCVGIYILFGNEKPSREKFSNNVSLSKTHRVSSACIFSQLFAEISDIHRLVHLLVGNTE